MTRALLATLALLLLAAAPAQARPLLSDADATELAETLAEATAAQGVCYGWQVSVQDGSGGPSGVDLGSNEGVGRGIGPSCTKAVELQGSVRYTCDSCESEDSSLYSVASNFPGAPDERDLKALGFDTGKLKDDDGDVALINLAGALPLITASKGSAPPVPPAEATELAPGDAPTGSPAVPDWLRENALLLVFFLLLTLGGIGWFVSQVMTERVQRMQTRPKEQSRG